MLFKTDNILYHLFRAMRPRQWIKNGVLFAPILFQGQLFNEKYFLLVVIGAIFFSGIASAVYLINDYIDSPMDRLHPIKKDRPIASGKLPEWVALFVAGFLIVLILPLSFIFLNKYFGLMLLVYIFLQALYNLKLKEVIILDALTITLGFIVRAFAGALIIPVSISSWLILAITGTSLLLAFGKRRAERTVLENKGISKESTRSILKHYPDSLLDSMISMSASFAIITYSLFTFQTVQVEFSKYGFGMLLEEYLPSTLIGSKLLMLTIPIVIYGIARYLYVIYEKREGESPERIIIQDRPLLLSGIIWFVVTVFIVS